MKVRRPGPDVLLAVLLPLLCVAALLLVEPDRAQPQAGPPEEARLSTASVACPPAIAGSADAVGVTTLAGDGTDGEVSAGLGQTTVPLRLRSGRVTSADSPEGGAVVVSGADALAPGLVAGRSQAAPLAATDCTPPTPEQWFTAAGADATHNSVLQLTNPNPGAAIADITVRSPGGVLDVPQLRGVTVDGGASATLDLGAIVPRRGELALEVRTSRGRLAVQLVDSVDQLGAGSASQDWIPAQAAPATGNLLLGLAAGAGERTLVLANPGTDELRATVKVVTPTSVYAPSGVEPVRVAPGSTEAVSMDDVLTQAVADGATGLLVESTGPVTAALRQVTDGDLSVLAPAPALEATTAAVVPPGQQRLLLAGPGGVGVATVTAYAPNGKVLATQDVELSPDTGADVALPANTALVTLTPQRTSVRAAVIAVGTGTAVVPLRPLVLSSLVPDVRPGVP